MGNPENSTPLRPSSVPAGARWDPKDPGFEWILGGIDDEGRRHGTYRSWTREGVLHGECNYDHGKVHGKNLNFHPDGTIASEADWVQGVIMDSVFFRSDVPTVEPFAQAAANVWSVRYYTREGNTNYTIRYFLRDRTECGPDGNPLPPRPGNVSPDARWFPDMDRWVDGEIERVTNTQVGHWRWWSKAGVLRHEEMRDAKGEATTVAQYEAGGAIEKKTTRNADGEQRDYYFEDGTLSMRHRSDTRRRDVYKGSWFRGGELDQECIRVYDGDALVSVTEKGHGGIVEFEARREGSALACMLYEGDGKVIAASGLQQDGTLTGPWRIFDAAGAVRRQVDMTALEILLGPTGQGLRWELGKALYRTDEPTFVTPDQLAGVDAEPWSTITGCFDAEVDQFPRLLRGLASSDPLVRSYCLGAIDSEIEHQGSTYPATARTIPWLARLLSHPNVDRGKLLATIQCAAQNVAPYVDDVQQLEPTDPARVAIEGTYKAVGAAWPYIFTCFGAATPFERQMILVLANYAPEATKDLVELAQHDSDPAMRACAVDSLTAMGHYDLTGVMPCLTDKDPLVRAASAIAIGLSKGPDAPREVVAGVREAIHGWKEIATRFRDLPYTDGHVLAYLSLAAGAIRSPDARSLAQALCAQIDEVDARSAVTYGQGLLELAFGDGERPFAKRFVEILDALASSKQFWVVDINAAEALDNWSLPRSQAELAALVSELESIPEPEAALHARMHANKIDDAE